MNINVEQLGNAKGLNKELAANIAGVYETYEELASASSQDLVATVNGLNKTTATAAITFAKIKVKASASSQPISDAAEEVRVVSTVTAPPGTTAVKKLMRRSSDLARQLGLPEARYVGCSNCRNDLELAAEDEGMQFEQFKQCPFCTAVFVADQVVHCYSCGQKMTQNGQCLNCGANASDDTNLKAMTILVRREQNSTGRVARATAQSLLQDMGYAAQVAAQARAERWIEKAEEGHQAQMPPFEDVSDKTRRYYPPANLPGQISLPDHVLYASVLTRHLSRGEMHELTQYVGERPGSICSGDREDRVYARELVGHLSRRSRIHELITALYQLHPQVRWAAELGIPDEKAGFGDTVFTGDARGAIINYGTTIVGGSQTINNK